MYRKQLPIVILLLCTLVACSDDDDPVFSPATDPSTAVSGASQAIVAPAIERLNLVEVYAAVRSGFSSTKSATVVPECQMSDACTSGSLEVCQGSINFALTFGACMLDGQLVDGTVDAVGETSGGTVVYDVTIGDLVLDGQVAFSMDGDCFSQNLDHFSVQVGGATGSATGSLRYCPGGPYPTGPLNWTFGGTLGDFVVSMMFDGTSTVSTMYSRPSAQETAECTVDLANAQATCS
jgi:hypothetical protein